MFQAREDRAFAAEAADTRRAQERGGEQLDRDRPFEASVVVTRQPDAAHPSGAEGLNQLIGAEDLSRELRLGEQILRVVLQVLLGAKGRFFAKEERKIRGDHGIFAGDHLDVPLPLLSGKLERLVEMGTDEPPTPAFHAQASAFSTWRR